MIGPVQRHFAAGLATMGCLMVTLSSGCSLPASGYPRPGPASVSMHRVESRQQLVNPGSEPTGPVQLAAAAEPATAQRPLLPAPEVDDGSRPPNEVEETSLLPATSGTGTGDPTLEFDLTGALQFISGNNPVVAHAAARYEEAYARLAAARVLWVPTLRAGVSFNHHDGNLQNSTGTILDADRSSLQAGLGVGAVGAGTSTLPGVVAQFHASDALFQPRIAGHAASARSHAMDSALNDTLLAGALAYLELLRAEQLRAVAEETEQHAQALAKLTGIYARTGQGLQSDADRAKAEAAIRANELARSEESVAVANARLVEALSADPYTRVVPLETTIAPIDLIDPDMPPGDLLALGLANRPELGEARHLVCEAVARYERERYAPLLPSVLLGLSQSTFGGGLGSDIDNSRRRFDLDAIAYWELRNLGFGERAKRDEHRAAYEQRVLDEARLLDRVAREINEAQVQVRSRRRQIQVAETAVAAATQSYQLNQDRIREGEGLPIEVLQSIQALDAARREYVRTVIDYNTAQFRLHRAVGWAIHL